MSGTGTGTASPSSQKKWYEDDIVVTDKDEERQTQFSRAGIGFDAIQVKLQELYEVGVLKLFIETEILKSNTGTFEPGFKDLYNPFSMTNPQRIGKDLLFTSDVEFSESGFVSGSLENDKKKIFLNQTEFMKYLLRLPKPISDIATSLDVKQDMNAYKYLQILGTELQDKILFLCDNFIQGYNQQYMKNKNDILRIQNEISDLKRLSSGPGSGPVPSDIQNRIIEKEKQLVQAKNVKIKLETKRANYKSACAILSNSTRRGQYNVSLVAAYPALKSDASSYSTVMVDWFKYKQYSFNFFKQVCEMFKPMIPTEMLKTRQEILIAIQEVATKLGAIFKPMFETFFFDELTTLLRNTRNLTDIVLNNVDVAYLIRLNQMVQQTNPIEYSWINVDAKFQKIISDTTFPDYFYKTELERLQSIAKFMANFDSEILTLFSLFKFEKNLNIFTRNPNDNKNVFERAEQDDDFFKRAENVNMLFQNAFYLKNILEMIVINLRGLDPSTHPLILQQAAAALAPKIDELLRTITNNLIPNLNQYQVKVQRYDYDTLLGSPSHSRFVENAFNGKISFISHYHKNNKFLVSSDLIQNNPVTITIPDGNYTLESLSSVVESELCSSCKWARKSEANMLWRCKYDSNNFLQLRLYFPYDNIPDIPNISFGSNYYFDISSGTNITSGTTLRLTIPEGEYKNVSQVLDAMQKTINDVIKKQSQHVTPPFTSTCKITLESNPASVEEVVTFYLEPSSVRVRRREETLRIILSPELSVFLSQNNPFIIVLSNNNNTARSLLLPPRVLSLSKPITINTRTKIDGEVYDASEIFGVTQRRPPVGPGPIQFFPDITVNALQISDNSNETRNCNRNNRGNFDPCIFLSDILLPGSTMELMDFGILNFTSKRINDELDFKAVDMKDIEKRKSSATRNVFKNEILEKTSVYMNNRLLHPKVPVITPVDILNSILYRYPCIPSPVKRELVEGSREFDAFIQERVNVPNFNAIVCLGKGEKDQTPSTTFKRVLEKTLMYDESDGRRNKLFCDLHYAICGPVYMDENPSREINRLTIMDQFTLQNNRPDVIRVGATLPIPQKPPFKVKGITPFYDYEKEYYKYLIYGECQESTFTFGCIKYYDPGERIGPVSNVNVNASELYDVIHVYSYQTDPSTGIQNVHTFSTIDNVYSYQQTHSYNSFIIVGNFQTIMFRNKYEYNDTTNPHIQHIRLPTVTVTSGSYVIWRFPNTYPVLPPTSLAGSYFDFSTIGDCVPRIDYTGDGIRISNILQVVTPDFRRIRFVVFANNSRGETRIYMPFVNVPGTWNPNQIVIDSRVLVLGQAATIIPYKISCSAISVNKTLQNIKKQQTFYTVMVNKHALNVPLVNYTTAKETDYGLESADLTRRISSIENNLLWLGLREKTQQRKILSCEIINVTDGTLNGLNLPIVFEDDDTIENIRVDLNNPEIVTVFGRFKATVSDDVPGANKRPNKIIRNVMVIYTNLQNAAQNDTTYGVVGRYLLTYDNFKEITINDVPEFQSFYSCFDGLVAASIDEGTMQQNIGILTVKKMHASGISIIGFHNVKMTAISEKSTVKDGTNPTPLLCYDYNMCADNLKIKYDAALPAVDPETDTQQGVFNPVTFYAFYDEIEKGAGAKTMTSLSKGVYALIHAKNPRQFFSTPSSFHVLNTWGIDLSSNQTLFYKRLYEPSATITTLKFNLKGYEKYMNEIVDTILSSAKAYYEEKIKSTFYEYGTIDGNPPILFKRDGARNVIVGGGKEEDAKQMLLATEYALDNDANETKKNRRSVMTYKKKIEIRIPDIMMSDEYLSAITEADRKNARMIFVNSIFKHSKQLDDIVTKENEYAAENKGAENNVVILDEYQIVLCSKNETIRNRFNELSLSYEQSGNVNANDFLTLSDDVFGFELTDSTTQSEQPSNSQQNNKNIIIVNEWNDKGFIGDYGAYAYSGDGALTLNQTMISKSQQMTRDAATLAKEAVTRIVPKYPNTSFLLNPVFSFHTLDPSKWSGVRSLFESGAKSAVNTQFGGIGEARYVSRRPSSFFQYPYSQSRAAANQLGFGLGPQGYGYGYGYDGSGDEVIRMQNKVLESSDIQSKNMKKINLQTMQTETRFKKIVLWLFDFRENKMLMTKTLIGKKVVLSLPVQNQQVGAIRGSGYSLLQQLCRRLFNQVDIIRKWTLEVAYAYEDAASTSTSTSNGITGIFIYSAKSFDLPKPTLELIYVNMQAVLNLTKGSIIIHKEKSVETEMGTSNENGSRLEINPRDIALVSEVFRVVPLIQGGIISSTSKEFNEIVASLVTKTPHQHLRSSISEKKRRENVEANINFLINLFFSQNSLFFVSGQLKYYIYSIRRSCKSFTIVKQRGYDDDSYLTCLQLFLQSEYDYKQKLNTFRVGCSMKKKIIADNFSKVWDSFWNDLIESQEQATNIKQLENEIGIDEMGEGEEGEEDQGEEGQGKGKEKGKGKDDRVTAPVCLNTARTTCKKMYEVRSDWNVSSYYPLAYNGILYNLDPSENPYGFNNEYYYKLENLEKNNGEDMFYGFKCMKYNGDPKNPILYLGGKYSSGGTDGAGVFEFNLKEKKIKPILFIVGGGDDTNILCIDMIGNKYLLVGGEGFQRVSIFQNQNGAPVIPTATATAVPLIIMNVETYVVTVVYDETATNAPRIHSNTPGLTKINKVCICKKRRTINEKDKNVYEYVGLFGGNIMIETAGLSQPYNIENIGYLVIKIPIEDSNPNVKLVARMYCIDSYLESTTIRGLTLANLPPQETANVCSIICDEQEGEQGVVVEKNKTTFYVGGYFNAFNYLDYKEFQKAGGAAAVNSNGYIKQGECNSILKLTITSSYDGTASVYRQQCVFEPIETNANKNNVVFNASLALNRVASNNYLIAFTAFFDKTVNLASANDTPVNTSLNVFNLKIKVNTQIMIPIPKIRVTLGIPIIKKNKYKYQCIAIVKDVFSKKYIANMSYTTKFCAYSFTCELNMEAPLRVIESTCNDLTITSNSNSVTEMCGIENQNGNQIDLYVSHEDITVERNRPIDQILYPLTAKSNYQQVGIWNVGTIPTIQSTSESTSDPSTSTSTSSTSTTLNEVDIFFRFVNSMMELSKIFKEYPSMMLFLQNIDYREKNEKITKNVLQKMYIDLETKTSLDDPATNIRDPKVINMDYSCNDIFYKITYMLEFWYIATNADSIFNVNTNENIFNLIKNFYDYFIFLLIYAGCIRLAQTFCDNYVELVLSSANNGSLDVLGQDNWKEKFMTTFEIIASSKTFKSFFNQVAPSYDRTFTNIMICSNLETYTGIAYVLRGLDKNLDMSIEETKQKALQNKIYKSNETFFSENDVFFTTLLASDSINTVDQINFCSFYKFQRLKEDRTPFLTNFGGMLGETVYVSINVVVSDVKVESAKLFEFLKVIIAYFKRLPSGAPIVDTGIGGPIKRIIFGGDFGCNLLHDSEVCSQFTKNGMKIYTMPNNSNAFIDNTNVSGNQIFIVDVDLTNSSSSSLVVSGGGGERGENKNIVKRLTIGEPLNVDNITNHKKTRRRYK